MTIITSVTKTYSFIGDNMVHTGYLIASNNFRLKQVFKSSWEELSAKPSFKVDPSNTVAMLQDAQ